MNKQLVNIITDKRNKINMMCVFCVSSSYMVCTSVQIKPIKINKS